MLEDTAYEEPSKRKNQLPPCIVGFCKNRGKYYFPRNETRRAKWIKTIEYVQSGLYVGNGKNSRICSAHFKPTDFRPQVSFNIRQYQSLKRTAIPSVFPWKPYVSYDNLKVAKVTKCYARKKPLVFVNDQPYLETGLKKVEEDPQQMKKEVTEEAIKESSVKIKAPASVFDESSVKIESESALDESLVKIENSESVLDESYTFDMGEVIITKVEMNIPKDVEIETQKMSTAKTKVSESVLDKSHAFVTGKEIITKVEMDIAEDVEIETQNESTVKIEISESVLDEPLDIVERVEIEPQKESRVEFEGTEKHDKAVQTDDCKRLGFGIHTYKHDDKALHFFTGLENFDKFMLVYNTIRKSGCKVKYVYAQPIQELDELEQFFMTLLILRRHDCFEEVAFKYQVTIKNIYNIFISWIRFMSRQCKNMDLFSRESDNLATQVVQDRTKCMVKKLPAAYNITLSIYNNKIQFELGINCIGLICEVSLLKDAFDRDRKIIRKRAVLSRFDDDEIMCKGSEVKGNKITSQKHIITGIGGSISVMEQRVIGLLKSYRILTEPMNQTEIVLSSEIVHVCVMLVNLRSNVHNKNVFCY